MNQPLIYSVYPFIWKWPAISLKMESGRGVEKNKYVHAYRIGKLLTFMIAGLMIIPFFISHISHSEHQKATVLPWQ